MFHNDWTLLQLAKERQRELEQKLKHDQLVRLARSTRGRRSRRFAGVFAGLGRLLIAVGGRMQARHKALLSDAALHATYRSQSTIRTQRG